VLLHPADKLSPFILARHGPCCTEGEGLMSATKAE
jgi:hypothetical protein